MTQEQTTPEILPIPDQINHYKTMISRLNHIGIMLSAEKNTNKLLDMILDESMQIANCDAASIYVKEEKDNLPILKFTNTRNTSRDFPFKGFSMPIDTNSISGSCAYTGESYNFESMDDIPRILGFKYNDFFDKTINYHTMTMLVIPMKDIKGEIVGVLQLINKKRNFEAKLNTEEDFKLQVIPFEKEEESIIFSLASQTAVLLERNSLMEEIQRLFDSFVESMVTTIEKRDPTTSGHSIRVAKYVEYFAKAVNRVNYGPYKDVFFTEVQLQELHYAALLHDIGKIGVSEFVLTKQNRLTDSELQAVIYRFNYYKKSLEFKKSLAFKKIQEPLDEKEEFLLNNLEDYCKFVIALNTKGFLPDEEEEKLKFISSLEIEDLGGEVKPLLSEYEVTNLIVKKGNLTNSDRNQMNMHADYTYQILKDIPWLKALKSVPKIAADHHEKLNGNGYPNHLKTDEIKVQSKMLAIIDIFEALTAIDRPYKKAMPVDKALKILEEEASFNSIDKDLLEIFIKEELFDTCLKVDCVGGN